MKRAGLVVGLLVSIAAGSTVMAQGIAEMRIYPLAVESTDSDGHRAENALDGSLKADSRWSCLQVDQLCILTIQTKRAVFIGADLAWWQNGIRSRTTMFDIEVSDDHGNTWGKVVTGAVSPPNEQLTRYDFGPAITGFLVRVIGHGNNANAWNSLLEIRLYADGPATRASDMAEDFLR